MGVWQSNDDSCKLIKFRDDIQLSLWFSPKTVFIEEAFFSRSNSDYACHFPKPSYALYSSSTWKQSTWYVQCIDNNSVHEKSLNIKVRYEIKTASAASADWIWVTYSLLFFKLTINSSCDQHAPLTICDDGLEARTCQYDEQETIVRIPFLKVVRYFHWKA